MDKKGEEEVLFEDEYMKKKESQDKLSHVAMH